MGSSLARVTYQKSHVLLVCGQVLVFFSRISCFRPTLRLSWLKMSELILTGHKTQIIIKIYIYILRHLNSILMHSWHILKLQSSALDWQSEVWLVPCSNSWEWKAISQFNIFKNHVLLNDNGKFCKFYNMNTVLSELKGSFYKLNMVLYGPCHSWNWSLQLVNMTVGQSHKVITCHMSNFVQSLLMEKRAKTHPISLCQYKIQSRVWGG